MNYRLVLNLVLIFVACTIFLPVGECREFIFVVNTSQSMNESDPLHVVQDSLTWSMKNFSAEDEVAVIAFKDEPIVVRPLSKIGDSPIKAFEFDYSGETNAGEALLMAINMFKLDYGTERNIIVISNGEISLNDPAATLKSWEDFNACLQQAKWLGISVYVVKLRYFGAPQNYHSFAHDAKEMPGDYHDLMTTLRTLMFDTFNAPHMELPVNTTQGKFLCQVPIFPANSLKFFLLSSNPGVAKIESKTDETISKDFVKVFEFNAPNANGFEFDLNYPQGTGLTLDVVAEVNGRLQTELRTSFFSANVLEITPVYNDSEQARILNDEFFDGKSLRVQVDGKIINSTIRDGVISVKLENTNDTVSLDKVFFEDLGIIFVGNNSAQVTVSGLTYLPWILALAGVSVILGLSYLLIRKKTLSRTAHGKKHVALKQITPTELAIEKLVRDKNFLYKGELIISVMKNPNKDYIEPRIFNLFRLNSSEPIDLTDVLKTCGIDFDFKDFQGIIFTPSVNGVYVENHSDCSLVNMNKTIVKGAYTELYHEDSIDVATPDRLAELVVTYRNLKPA